jgi:hypothetical protein
MKKKFAYLFVAFILLLISFPSTTVSANPVPPYYYQTVYGIDGIQGFTVTAYSNDIRGRSVPTIIHVDTRVVVESGQFLFQFRMTRISGTYNVAVATFIVSAGTSQNGPFLPVTSRLTGNTALNTWHSLPGVAQRTSYFQINASLTLMAETTIPINNNQLVLLNRSGVSWTFSHTCPITRRQITPPPSNWVRVPYTRIPNYRTTYENFIRANFRPNFSIAGYDVHHMRPLFLGGTNDVNNLIHLNPVFHRSISGWFNNY